jgi:hypothetical protein
VCCPFIITKLESAWFQPLNLKCDFLVSKFAFKCGLHRYDEGGAAAAADAEMDEEEREYEEKRRIRREKDRERREKSGKISKRVPTEADYSATRAQLAAVEEYVLRGDADEVARERTVTLAIEQPKPSTAGQNGGQNNNNGGNGNGNNVGGGGGGAVAHLSTKHPGRTAIDRRVRVFWPEEGAFFNGIVAAYSPKTGKHTVRYDDGDVEEVALGEEKMEWLEPGGDTLGVAAVSTAANGDISDPTKPPGWWPVVAEWPKVEGDERRRKIMGTEVGEQETYGVDYVTARDVIACFKKVLPEYTEDDLWEISDELMMQVNASYGPMTPDTAATQSLALAAEDLAESLERRVGPRWGAAR